MKIRKIKQTDITECTKILKKAYGFHPYNEFFKGISARLYTEGKYKNCKKHSFVAVDEKNKLIAFIFLNISAWSEGLQVVLEEIVVSPKLQGRGIGKKLMQHAHDYLHSLEIKSVMLWTKKDVRLIEFYKKQGYFVADDYVVMFKNI